MVWDILLDATLDTLKVLPVIFIVYVLIEFIETREGNFNKLKRAFSGKLAPLCGAGIGIIPQCGFSVVATRLFQDGYIYIGTLIAVYLATSDEAVPIMFSRAVIAPALWLPLVIIIATKFLYATACGFLINMAHKTPVKEIGKDHDEEGKHDEHDHHEELHADGCCHHEITGERKSVKDILLHPLLHSLKIAFYIFVINYLFGLLVEMIIGEEILAEFLSSAVYLQPLFSCVVGLIPNCASSVLITELYANGAITLSATVAGLAVNSGLGMAILFRDRKHLKRALAIVGITFVLALVLGYGMTVVEAIIAL